MRLWPVSSGDKRRETTAEQTVVTAPRWYTVRVIASYAV